MGEPVLVTGGAGFIGSHLCERLLRDGEDVLCVDDLSTGSRDHVAHLSDEPRFRLMGHDVAEPLFVDASAVYHLACPAAPRYFARQPVRTMKTSLLGTLHMLGLARRLGCPMLQASTSEVYGDPDEHPQTEAYWGHVNPIGPRASYDESKRCGETLCMAYRHDHGVAVKIARIFNTYGPRMDPGDGRVVSAFIVRALRGEPLSIHGDGSQTRSFCYVDDLVDGLVRFMATDPALCGPINLGNPTETTIGELAELVVDVTGSPSAITFSKRTEDDPKRRRPAIEKAAAELGWRPRTRLREGLERTAAYFDATLRAK